MALFLQMSLLTSFIPLFTHALKFMSPPRALSLEEIQTYVSIHPISHKSYERKKLPDANIEQSKSLALHKAIALECKSTINLFFIVKNDR
jgi:hypothetical protein